LSAYLHTVPGGLGRITPTDFTHVDKWPLTAATMPSSPVPVAIGINWYDSFDHPTAVRPGEPWIGLKDNLGSIRGGHCVCLLPAKLIDSEGWYEFYDQGHEGACVGFGCSRMMSLLNRKRYDARWLWNQAKMIDEWPDTNPGDDNGTSVRAACDVLRLQGHVVYRSSNEKAADVKEGIAANRWATNAQQVLDALGTPEWDHVRILNSWGRGGYPHIVRMPAKTLDRLLQREDGEACLVTDR
jgi:hypothetical protein